MKAMRSFLVVIFLGCVTLAFAGDEKFSDITIVVLKDFNGKPVRNASVVLHPVKKNGKQEKGGLQLKTDKDGRTNYSGVPYGSLRIQVISPGYQTFGKDYEIDQPAHEIVIRMERPKEQYSIYK